MSTRRRFFQSIAAAICAAALDINGKIPVPIWKPNPAYETAEFEEVILFHPKAFHWVNPLHAQTQATGARFNFNTFTRSWEKIPEFIQLTPSQEPRN